MTELEARERIILAVDTSSYEEAERLVALATEAGTRYVKLGLELSSATSWRYCSELAAEYGLDWVADAKIGDIPNTTRAAAHNINSLDHKPFGITTHASLDDEAMRAAQEEVGEDTIIFGVTILTSIKAAAAIRKYNIHVNEEAGETPERAVREKVLEFAMDTVGAGAKGVVCSPLEVGLIKSEPVTRDLFTMIPGTRSARADLQDQARVGTPAAAIRDRADLLVIGRQITQAADPALAYEHLVLEIEGAIK